VRKIPTLIKIFFLILLIFALSFLLLKTKPVQNLLLYKSGLLPKDIVALNKEINSVPPTDTSNKRTQVLNDVDTFIKSTITGDTFSTKAYVLIKVRLDQALNEIPKTKVPKGEVKLWYIYNMGVIAKSDTTTMAIDIANRFVYTDITSFINNVDVLLITHPHNDHLDSTVLKKALANGTTVIVPDEKVLVQEGMLIKSSNGIPLTEYLSNQYGIKSDKLIGIKPGQVIKVKDAEITGYPAIHMGSEDFSAENGVNMIPTDWFYINLSGFCLLHTGDGTVFTTIPEFSNKRVDALITHNVDSKTNGDYLKIVPDAKAIIPLHVLELGHGAGIAEYMMYEHILRDYSNGYLKTPNPVFSSNKTKLIPMIWGESIVLK
jgi:L-ascorbate metabolism protein UlaG (beta-lactamase superfamily)